MLRLLKSILKAPKSIAIRVTMMDVSLIFATPIRRFFTVKATRRRLDRTPFKIYPDSYQGGQLAETSRRIIRTRASMRPHRADKEESHNNCSNGGWEDADHRSQDIHLGPLREALLPHPDHRDVVYHVDPLVLAWVLEQLVQGTREEFLEENGHRHSFLYGVSEWAVYACYRGFGAPIFTFLL